MDNDKFKKMALNGVLTGILIYLVIIIIFNLF